MICVVDVIEGPASGRRFWLRPNQRIAVGRISTADFSVPADPHMSRNHLIFEANQTAIRVRDAGSANGTFVNNMRISNLELCSGDRVRAGATTFEISLLADNADPHQRDGVQLDGSSLSVHDRGLSISTRIVHFPEQLIDGSDSHTDSPDESTDDALTMRSDLTWWIPYFKPSKTPGILDQTAYFVQKHCDLVDVIKRMPKDLHVASIVNHSQLDPSTGPFLMGLSHANNLSHLSRTLCLIRNDKSDDYWSIVRASVRRDAIVCIAASTPIETSWATELLDCLSFPSLLAGLLHNANEQPRTMQRLLKNLTCVIYEKNRQGELCLAMDAKTADAVG